MTNEQHEKDRYEADAPALTRWNPVQLFLSSNGAARLSVRASRDSQLINAVRRRYSLRVQWQPTDSERSARNNPVAALL